MFIVCYLCNVSSISARDFMEKKMEIRSLLEKPLWQLTGEEYVRLHAYACTINNDTTTAPAARVTGVRALAEYLSCCESTIYALKREGVLDSAIISHVGKNIVFDGERARELAQAYMREHRQQKNANKI